MKKPGTIDFQAQKAMLNALPSSADEAILVLEQFTANTIQAMNSYYPEINLESFFAAVRKHYAIYEAYDKANEGKPEQFNRLVP